MSRKKDKAKSTYMERYWSDKKFREKERARHKKNSKAYYYRKHKEDPKWNADRQREYRKTHPEAFNKLMARYYLRKLSKQTRKELFKEFDNYED